MRGRFLLATLALWLAGSCAQPAPEARVRETIESACRAAEQGDLDGLMKTVADGYADARGRDRNALRGLVAFYLRQHGRIHVFFREKALELQGPDDARVRAAVALAGRPIGSGIDLTRIQADLLRVDLTLRREDDDWKVAAAAWEPAGAADFLGD